MAHYNEDKKFTDIRSREQVWAEWDRASVVIREQAVGSTIIYPMLRKGAAYPSYVLHEHYTLAGVNTVEEAVHYCQHHSYYYGVLGYPNIKCTYPRRNLNDGTSESD